MDPFAVFHGIGLLIGNGVGVELGIWPEVQDVPQTKVGGDLLDQLELFDCVRDPGFPVPYDPGPRSNTPPFSLLLDSSDVVASRVDRRVKYCPGF